ncbi:MAG: HlyD family type I secretion periplasmic adaptor subunit [Burkholderiaceae bacterium]
MNATSSPLAGPIRLGVGAIVMALLAVLAWSAMAPLSGAVVTRGLVRSELHRKAVQHPEGGAVRVIHVREGDRVQEGQVLLELEGVGSDANLQLLRELHLFESLRHSRLEAEQLLAERFGPGLAVPPAGGLLDGRYQQAVAREMGLFKARREAMDQQLHTLGEQIRSLDAEQQALRRQAAAAEEGLRLAQAEADMSRHLQSQQFVSRARLLADERAVADYRTRMGEFEAQLAQSAQRVNDVRLRMAALRHNYQRQASEELRESAGRLAELRERLRPVESAVQRLQVRAPADGRVVGLRLSGSGQVVGPRDVIMQIVPEDEGPAGGRGGCRRMELQVESEGRPALHGGAQHTAGVGRSGSSLGRRTDRSGRCAPVPGPYQAGPEPLAASGPPGPAAGHGRRGLHRHAAAHPAGLPARTLTDALRHSMRER